MTLERVHDTAYDLMASLINTHLIGAQVSEVYKWLCFVSYLCLSEDERNAGNLDDVQCILEYVARHRARDLSESGQWWEQFNDNRGVRMYASVLIRSIRNSPRTLLLGLNPQQKKSLALLFSEFRGLALTLRSARDSEAHGCLAAGEALFNSSYGIQALRLFDVANALYELMLVIANTHRDEVTRFGFRVARPTPQEIDPYRNKVIEVLTSSGILNVNSDETSSASQDEDAVETQFSMNDLLAQVEQALQDGYEANMVPIQELREAITQELTSIRSELRAFAIQHTPIAQDHSEVPAGDRANETRVNLPPIAFSGDLGKDLVALRDVIFESTQQRVPGFKHYHNILQRPIIRQILQTRASTYSQVKDLPEFQSRIIGMSRSFALPEQEGEFAEQIDRLLSHYNGIPF
jgi:hypothetical protein